MAKLIEVDTLLLARDKNTAQQKLDQVRGLIKEIYKGMQELDAMWDGSANAAFRQQFASDQEHFEAIFYEMQTFIESLEFAVAEYDKCENQVNAAVNAIRI